MLILGVDPGSRRIGFGFIEKEKGIRLVDYGTIEIKSPGREESLAILEREIKKLIDRRKPALAALEKLYFVKNQKTAMAVAEARGVIVLALAKNKIPLLELAPTEVKQTLTDNGRADKKAVAKMVKVFLKREILGHDDASDALAIAIAAAAKSRLLT